MSSARPSRLGLKARVDILFQNTLVRYLFGIAVVASAFALRIWLIPLTGTGAPFVLFFAALLVTSLFAGVGPGICALLISMPLATYTFVTRAGYSPFQAAFQSLLFAVDGMIVVYLTFLMEKGRQAAQDANRQLRGVSAELRQTLQTAGTGLTYCSRDLRYLSANPAYAQWIGLPLEQIVGRPIAEVMGQAAYEIIRPRVERVLSGERVEYEDELPIAGALKCIQVVYTPDRDASGNVVGWVASVIDITMRKHIEKEQQFLAEAGAVLAASLDYEQTLVTVAQLVVRDFADLCMVEVMDEHEKLRRLKVVSTDPTNAALCTYFEQMPIDRDRPYLVRTVIETRQFLLIERVSSEYLESVAQGPEHLQALRALNPTSLMALPLMMRGQLLGALVFISSSPSRTYGPGDLRLAQALADRAAMAIENARLYRASVHATQLRDQVLGVVAHDLRNPLSTILSQIWALKRHGPEPERRSQKRMEVIHRATMRMNHLIQDLLDVALMEAGQLTIERARLSARGLIAEAADTQRALASSASLELRVDVDLDVPEVWADRNRLLQVFENLIGNAIKFTNAGGRITVGAASRDDEVVFWVADTGCGMASENLPRVFDRFWQATRAGGQGAGLGLPITKSIVEAHGGRIWVESTVGRGSTFFLTIPKASAA